MKSVAKSCGTAFPCRKCCRRYISNKEMIMFNLKRFVLSKKLITAEIQAPMESKAEKTGMRKAVIWPRM